MARTPAAAVAVAKRTTRKLPSGMCQQFTRQCFGIGQGFGSARAAWLGAKVRHHVTRGSEVPPGVPVYFTGGKYGHAAVSLGNGLCRSTDWPRAGQVSTVSIDHLARVWRRPLVGYTEDINGTPIPGVKEVIARFKGQSAPKPATNRGTDMDLSQIKTAVRNKGSYKHGKELKAALAAEVGKGTMNLASSVLGKGFRDQYKLLQQKYQKAHSGKVSPNAADGMPGMESLKWLAARHRFDVVA